MARFINPFRRHSLDDRLLSGELSPDTGKGRERAEELVSARHRAESAKSLRDLIDDSLQPHPSLFSANLRVERQAIRDNQVLILLLAEELEQLESVDPLGVILADRLIRDGDS